MYNKCVTLLSKWVTLNAPSCIYGSAHCFTQGDSRPQIIIIYKEVNYTVCPVLYKHEVLQVGGSLKNSSLPYEKLHQIILLSRHHLTEVTVRADHQRLLCVGPQYLLESLRVEYRISRGRQIQQSILDEHSLC